MSAWDDPNSLRCSNRKDTDKLYKELLKKKDYAELLRVYLKARCAAPDIWKAYEGLVKQAKQPAPDARKERG